MSSNFDDRDQLRNGQWPLRIKKTLSESWSRTGLLDNTLEFPSRHPSEEATRAPGTRHHRQPGTVRLTHDFQRIHPPQRRDHIHASSARHPRLCRNHARTSGGGGATPCIAKLRPLATAGAIVLGAGFVVFAPPSWGPVPGLATVRDVTLAAGDTGLPDLLTPWADVFNTASSNATTLWDNFALAPAVGLQQALANQSDLWRQFFNDPTSSTLASVMQQMQANLDAVSTGVGLQGTTIGSAAQITGWSADSIAHTVLQHTMIGDHALMFAEIPGYLPAADQSLIGPIINFLGSPESAIIMGALGPMISPWVALSNSITDGDDWNTTLANMVGAYFNGADLNLDSLVPTINGLIGSEFPPGMTMAELDIAFGGLLSTGSVQVADYTSGGTEVPAVGGSIFNSVGLQFTGVPAIGSLTLTSEPIGPIAAWETLSQTVSALLGSGWSSDDATTVVGGGLGSPSIGLEVTAPLFDLLGVSSGSGAAVTTDLSSLVQDVMSLF